MALFVWTTALATGHPRIDDEHHVLIERVNNVLECIAERADAPTLEAALQSLGLCTRAHFMEEERAMREAGYGKAQEHGQEHAELLQEMDAVLDQLRRGETVDTMELYNRLTRWVIQHIQQQDVALAQHLSIQPAALL
ncbi:MAG: bacteriohemerythrin [Rhodoferax sp.]